MTERAPSSTSVPILLRSDRLAIEIARPGSAYAGTRFDWTGFVTQVTLDGTHTFCVPESLEPGQGTGGIGLCNEFGIERPVGYGDAQPGECFPKLGIGLLVRPDEDPYRFAQPHEIAHHFPIHVTVEADRAIFAVEPLDCRGYAARLEKVLSVREDKLTIAYRLENVGVRPIATHEYCHNFTGIDGHPLGPDYRLRMAQPVAFEDLAAIFARQGNRPGGPPRERPPKDVLDRITAILEAQDNEMWPRATPEQAFYCRLVGLVRTDRPQWELAYLPSGAVMREYDDFSPARIAVWGTTHVISAEVFVDIDLEPGEAQAWTRRYTFSSGAA